MAQIVAAGGTIRQPYGHTMNQGLTGMLLMPAANHTIKPAIALAKATPQTTSVSDTRNLNRRVGTSETTAQITPKDIGAVTSRRYQMDCRMPDIDPEAFKRGSLNERRSA